MTFRTARLFTLLSISVAAFVACISSKNGDSPPMPGADAGSGDDGGNVTTAAFGLDTRAANTTCRAAARPPQSVAVKFERVFSSVTFNLPTAIAQAPGDTTHVFVSELYGTLQRVSLGAPTQRTLALTLPGKVKNNYVGGFLNFAFHPRFAQNGQLFVSYDVEGATATTSRSIVARFTTTDGGATFGGYTPILGPFDQPLGDHAGGALAFGPDGYLYVGFGDSGCCNDVSTKGQSLTGFFSKVLRIDIDTPGGAGAGSMYSIPDGNPFKGGGGEPATWAYGFRNPWRLSFDRATGALWVADVGQDLWEELDRVTPGANYGWPCREGAHDLLATDATHCPPGHAPLVDPYYEYGHPTTAPQRSITGGYVYRGAAVPGLQGRYIFGDYVTKEIWALGNDATTGAPVPTQLNQGVDGEWVSFGEDLAGELYAVDMGGSKIYAMKPDTALPSAAFPTHLGDTGCFLASDPKTPAPGLVPYDVNAPLFSDGADKDRFVAIPDGTTATVTPDGHLDLPVGSVVAKVFRRGDRRLETRLLMHHDDGDWAGYTYQWNDAQTDAILLADSEASSPGGSPWYFPSRFECLRCHTQGTAGTVARTLGLDLRQLDRSFTYAGGRSANQLDTLTHIGWLALDPGQRGAVVPFAHPSDASAALERRARAYMHANCAHCHQPEGGPRTRFDLRAQTPIANMGVCNATPVAGDLGVAGAKVLVSGDPAKSLLALRMARSDGLRMPPIGRLTNDDTGVALIQEWIRSAPCP